MIIPLKNNYVKIAIIFCLVISIFFILELYIFPPKITLEIFDHNYDFFTHTRHLSYYTKILITQANERYILPERFYCNVSSGDEIIVYKSLVFSWPLKLQIKNYIIPIGIFSESEIWWILLSSIILFVLIYFIFVLFPKPFERNDILGKWLISIPLILLLMLLYLGITQTYYL